MKKKVLLSSILTIALCLCLIAGSTFALFTSTSEVNIAVTAGKVDMVAGIAITSVESVQGNPNGTIEDENGAKYAYDYSDNAAPFNFVNGGTAEVEGAVLTIDKITPGDRINLEISGTNNSNVAIQYRYVIECLSGDDLMKGLELTINNVAIDKYMESYTSPWAPLAVGTSMTNVPITIELPVSAGNEFQKESTEIRVLVEAVQGNAVVDANTDPVITYYNTAATAEELAEVLADPYLPVVDIVEDLTQTIAIDLTNKTINANGNDVALTFTGNLNNVVVSGIVDTDGAGRSIDVGAASGDIAILDSYVIDAAGGTYGAVYVGKNVDVTISGCEFTGIGKSYGVYGGTGRNLTITNCTFKDFGSWAILPNGTMQGAMIIDDCTFEKCSEGIAKAGVGGNGLSGIVEGGFTFTNNTLISCTGHDGVESKMFDISSNGNYLVSGNTRDGADYVPGTADGIN